MPYSVQLFSSVNQLLPVEVKANQALTKLVPACLKNQLLQTFIMLAVNAMGFSFCIQYLFTQGLVKCRAFQSYVATAKLPQPLPAISLLFSIQLFQLSASLLQLRFLRLQSFSPSECQDKNPASEGVVVQRRAGQCYLSCEACDHLGMTVYFQT